MSDFTQAYQHILAETWQEYIGKNKKLPVKNENIAPIIYESWQRSQKYKVDPFTVKDMQLEKKELERTLDENQELIQVAHPYLQHLYTFVKGTNFVLALTDKNGYVIDLIGDDDMIRTRTHRSGLIIGSCRSEEYAGTNGIGTCLLVGKPIQIWAEEHYIKPHHRYVCSAAPIKDEDGEIIGCLDVIGPIHLPHTHTLAMVSASADAIEREIKMKHAYEKISVVNRQLSTTIEYISSGVIMIDNVGMITQYNKRVCDILGIKNDRLSNRKISDIIDMENSSIDLNFIDNNFQNREVSITTTEGKKLALSLSASEVCNDLKQKTGILLAVQELKKIHKLVNTLSGFTATYTFADILGESVSINAIKGIGEAAAHSNSSVLILGESGTGKELLAQSIHNASHRANAPFIAINCGSLPKGLIESELFGYERGAFTGANREGHPGKFELVDGGTIFLDEIGDMPLELQTSLLRVLQSKEIVRIGGKQSKQIDVRIIAATNIDLLGSVQKKEFREDLYYRLNVLTIEVPPLRQRTDDITLLTDHFIASQNRILGKNIKGVTEEAKRQLQNYAWPGNIRELENIIERAMNLTQNEMLSLEDLPQTLTGASPAAARPTRQGGQTYQLLMDTLRATRGNVSKASEQLKIPKRTLYRRIEKFEIDLDEFRLL